MGGAVSLPGLSALASVAAAPSPQARVFGVGPGLGYPAASPTPTSVGGQGNHPVSRSLQHVHLEPPSQFFAAVHWMWQCPRPA